MLKGKNTYMNKNKFLVVTATTLATLGLMATATGSAKANEVKDGDNTYWVVESGDTLSKIAQKYNVSFELVHANNTDKVSNADLIFAGQKLLVNGKSFDKNKVVTAQAEPAQVEAPVEETVAPVQETPAEQVAVETPVATPAPVAEVTNQGGEHPNRANRRVVESTNNYNTFTGNGYLGAYQFAPSTWNSIASRYGLDASDFSPANQDRMADIYATERYQGWDNVPMSGGW